MTPIRPLLVAVLLSGCEESVPADAACLFDPPPPGEVYAGEVVCANPLPEGHGDVRANDLLLANSLMSAVVRHPVNAATMPGIGGLTITDAAPWDRRDGTYEIIPLVGDGWMTIDALEQLPDGFRVSGEGAPLADRPDRYRRGPIEAGLGIEPDSPWLQLQTIDGLWMHPTGPAELLDGWLYTEQTVLGHDGIVEEDLGGAIRVTGASRLLIADHATALSLKGDTARPVRVTVPRNAGILHWWADDTIVARTPVRQLTGTEASQSQITLELDLGSELTHVHWSGAALAPTDVTPITSDTALSPSDAVRVELTLTGTSTAAAVPSVVRWDSPWGLASAAAVDGTTSLYLPEGDWPLTIEPAPGWLPTQVPLTVSSAAPAVDVPLAAALDTTGIAPANLLLPSRRDWTVRTGPDVVETLARMDGLVSTRLLATHDAGAVSTGFDDIRPQPAWHLPHSSGWALWAWPVTSNGQLGGHGAPDVGQLSPQLAFERADGGTGSNRTVVANLRWIELVRPDPASREALPSMVRLGHPGEAPFTAWEPWLRILDGFRPLYPIGDLLWLVVPAGQDVTGTAVQTALQRGTFSTGTGGAITWSVDGEPPGGVLPTPAGPHVATVRIQPAASHLDQAVLIDSRRQVLQRWSAENLPTDPTNVPLGDSLGDWLLVVAWSSTTGDWATTPPIWARPPYTPENEDTGVDSGAPEESGAPN